VRLAATTRYSGKRQPAAEIAQVTWLTYRHRARVSASIGEQALIFD
jgi:hypothetical protein